MDISWRSISNLRLIFSNTGEFLLFTLLLIIFRVQKVIKINRIESIFNCLFVLKIHNRSKDNLFHVIIGLFWYSGTFLVNVWFKKIIKLVFYWIFILRICDRLQLRMSWFLAEIFTPHNNLSYEKISLHYISESNQQIRTCFSNNIEG